MRAPRLLIEPDQIEGKCAQLTAAQARYLRQVLRLRNGAKVTVANGQGQLWQAVLAGEFLQLAGPIAAEQTELATIATIACAVPKGDRWDWLLQKATELGVGRIVPLIAARSVVRPDAARHRRWQAIVREAAEQSERLILPVIELPADFAAFVATCQDEVRLVCTARGGRPSLLRFLPTPRITLVFGPEGGFEEAEVARARTAGFAECGLGKRILRAETAPLVALSWLAAWDEGLTEDA
ncbi:RsmE family RNA methyltransferase [Gloeobacter kilaueensis]|uniref:Ribosomal RNA small subunit methyltransferase E n=1 Tax=Gloeobacter kilaueensis (strain ATCC BAA-2537 / CCAP 1431/1 / ULC 316 / JS1) TaxID=1183438 RepID=U5QL84_GLOK1|nr:RsmE family RNA methyltransferase [Gloeobacter kilaueensis]AGY59696.1 16S ribosomal RNA methyltransferase RsmE [Gloeobacter kilaueensis JS1]